MVPGLQDVSSLVLPTPWEFLFFYKAALMLFPTASWRSPCPARALPSASSVFGYSGFPPAGTGGDKHPRRGVRGRSHLTAMLRVWAAASWADKDAAPYLNIITEMAQLAPPPCPHRGCATPRQPQRMPPHPPEEHPWGIAASSTGEPAEGRKRAFGDGNAKPPTHGHPLPRDLAK